MAQNMNHKQSEDGLKLMAIVAIVLVLFSLAIGSVWPAGIGFFLFFCYLLLFITGESISTAYDKRQRRRRYRKEWKRMKYMAKHSVDQAYKEGRGGPDK